jgi:G3E family GTPase
MKPLATFRISSRRADRLLPVTIITGFLGSGKTTLVNHILANRQGVRAAVLVNEIGALAIDNDLIVAADASTIALSNGCICCSINNDLVDGIVRVLMRVEPVDHLIVETSGAADPLPVALTFLRSEFRGAVRLDAIVATADAEQFSLEQFDGPTARNQLRYADAILLNKSDLVGAERLDQVEAMLHAVNPEARILRTTHAAVPLPLILDAELSRGPLSGGRHGRGHLDADGYVSVSFTSERPLSVSRFQTFLDSGRPAGLFRAKGFLAFAETGRSHVFHLVGNRFSLAEDDRDGARNTRLVLIGRDIEPAELQACLQACAA